jgi:hypothetical protein
MQLGGRGHFLHPFIWSHVSGMMRFLTAGQKQQRVNVSEKLRHITSDDVTLLSKYITGDKSWIYSYNIETKQQFSQWKKKKQSAEHVHNFL